MWSGDPCRQTHLTQVSGGTCVLSLPHSLGPAKVSGAAGTATVWFDKLSNHTVAAWFVGLAPRHGWATGEEAISISRCGRQCSSPRTAGRSALSTQASCATSHVPISWRRKVLGTFKRPTTSLTQIHGRLEPCVDGCDENPHLGSFNPCNTICSEKPMPSWDTLRLSSEAMSPIGTLTTACTLSQIVSQGESPKARVRNCTDSKISAHILGSFPALRKRALLLAA